MADSYEDPNYGQLVYCEDESDTSKVTRIEQLTCLEPECERGPCKQPEEHERWVRMRDGCVTYPAQINGWAESNARRHNGFAVLCRNCVHWDGRLTVSAVEGRCRRSGPYTVNGNAEWPLTYYGATCGEWEPSMRIVRVIARRRTQSSDCVCGHPIAVHVCSLRAPIMRECVQPGCECKRYARRENGEKGKR